MWSGQFYDRPSEIIQIKQKVDYLLVYKLYLHPFDRVEGRRPETGQSDVSAVYRPSR